MAFNYFSYGQDVAVIGMKADSTVDVIDSFAGEGAIAVGKAVERGTDPAKQVKASVTASKVIGISIFEQKADETPLYPDGYAVPVCTFGDVWVEVAETVTAGASVYLSTAGAWGSSTGSAVTGMTYMTSAGAGELAIVRVRK